MRTLFIIFACICIMPFTSEASHQNVGKGKSKWHLSVAAIFRDEAPYLKEWIET